MKRDMWQTLRGVVSGKAVVLTTRESLISIMTKSIDLRPLDSMEEASALADYVSILAKRMLGKAASLRRCQSTQCARSFWHHRFALGTICLLRSALHVQNEGGSRKRAIAYESYTWLAQGG